jgi:hypothetical protein
MPVSPPAWSVRGTARETGYAVLTGRGVSRQRTVLLASRGEYTRRPVPLLHWRVADFLHIAKMEPKTDRGRGSLMTDNPHCPLSLSGAWPVLLTAGALVLTWGRLLLTVAHLLLISGGVVCVVR